MTVRKAPGEAEGKGVASIRLLEQLRGEVLSSLPASAQEFFNEP